MHLDGGDVAKLNNHQLREIMNVLLAVEANENGIPLAELELNTREWTSRSFRGRLWSLARSRRAGRGRPGR